MVGPIFQGSEKETIDLLAAAERNCDCKKDPQGRIVGLCGAHQALLDQRFLDGVLKWRRRREYLWQTEGLV